MFVLGMADSIRGPLFPELLNYFKLSNSEGSISFAVAAGAAFVGNVASGHVFQFLNLSRALCLSLFLMGMGLFLMGVAPSYSFFLAATVVFGLSLGMVQVTQNVIVTESVEPSQKSKALSGLHTLFGLSSLIAPLVASYSPIVFGPWRSAYFITSALAFVITIGAVIVKAEPRFAFYKIAEKPAGTRNSFWTLLVFGGVLAFYVVAEIMITTRLALYMRTYFNLDLESSSLYVTCLFIFLLLGRLIFTFKSFKSSYRTQLSFSLVLSILFLILGLKFHPIFLVLTGLSMAPYYPISLAYISEQTGVNSRQFITFAISVKSFCIIAMHLGVGYLTDHFGLINALGAGLVAFVLALLCVHFHPKTYST